MAADSSPDVVVVGGINIDICGTSFKPLTFGDSNPGRVTFSLGGVGRNICHNLSLMGVKTSFLTVLGGDAYAKMAEESCLSLGIDLSRARREKDENTSTYICVNSDKGDMALAISDMDLCEKITPEYLRGHLDVMNRASLVVVDGNLSERTLSYIAENCASPLLADPVSAAKSVKLLSVIGRLDTIKPNRVEAARLSGIDVTDEASARAAADRLLSTGLKRLFLTMGKDGVLAAEGDTRLIVRPLPARTVSTNGAGDAFMAALCWARIAGLGLEKTALAASAAAAITTESAAAINPCLSIEAMRGRISCAD